MLVGHDAITLAPKQTNTPVFKLLERGSCLIFPNKFIDTAKIA